MAKQDPLRRPLGYGVLVLAFVGSVLAGLVPIALTAREVSAVGPLIQTLGAEAGAARQTRIASDKISSALTGFAAIALKIDDAELTDIIADTDAAISVFDHEVKQLSGVLAHRLSPEQDAAFKEAVETLLHSWEEVKTYRESPLEPAERNYHFLQIASGAKTARDILYIVETRASAEVDRQTDLIFNRLSTVATLLIAAMVIAVSLSATGTLGIFRSMLSARRAAASLSVVNEALVTSDEALKMRTGQLVEAQRLGKLGDWSQSLSGDDLWWSGETYDLLGYDPRAFTPKGEQYRTLFVGDGSRRLQELQAEVLRDHGVRRADFRLLRGDGSHGDFELTCKVMTDANGMAISLQGTIQDISERKAAETKLERLAYCDQLTGLGNRAQFKRHLEGFVSRCATGENGSALLLIDLDKFKEVNDLLGHAAGDELLVKVATLTQSTLLPGSFIARLGGDEFAVLMPEHTEGLDAEHCAARILAALSQPIALERGEVTVGASIGIARLPKDGTTPGEVLRHADLALYSAKEFGRNRFAFFEYSMRDDLQFKTGLVRDLRKAMAEDSGLDLHYQPQVDLRTGEVSGFEALIRWSHPVHGNVPPDTFIPIAENARVIGDVGNWVMRRAIATSKRWAADGKRMHQVAVNMSAAQVWHRDFVKNVASILAEFDFPAEFLCLELTESIFANQFEGRVRESLLALKQLGVRLALDDFGTGYSSLGYLTKLPFDKLKIDRIFVSNVDKSDRAKELLNGIIALGRGLGMEVIAEGAETAEEVQILQAFKCHAVQGYYFARPCQADAAIEQAQILRLQAKMLDLHGRQPAVHAMAVVRNAAERAA